MLLARRHKAAASCDLAELWVQMKATRGEGWLGRRGDSIGRARSANWM